MEELNVITRENLPWKIEEAKKKFQSNELELRATQKLYQAAMEAANSYKMEIADLLEKCNATRDQIHRLQSINFL